MKKNVIWFIVVVVGTLLQTTWPDALKLQGVLPDVALLLVVYFAVMEGEERAMFTGLIGGVYQDVASDATLGHHVLCLVAVGFVMGRLSTRLVTEHPVVKAGLVFLAALSAGILYIAIQYVQQPANGAFNPILTSAIPSAFYTALLTPVVFLILGWSFQAKKTASGGRA